VLKYFELNKTLSSTLRNKMTHLIISHCLKKSYNKKISTLTLGNLSEHIVELFPTESKETYYILYKKEGKKVTTNRGKLWDKCNMRKVIRQITPVNSTEINVISNLQQIPPIIEYESKI